jgi:hypothetical protein
LLVAILAPKLPNELSFALPMNDKGKGELQVSPLRRQKRRLRSK